MVKSYNKSILEIFGLNATKGEVGIEVEVEGKRLIEGKIAPYWKHERDGSLRGQENAEYILAKPIDRREVRRALDDLFGALDKNGAVLRNNSPNASVHVHLNLQPWSLRKTYVLICLWYIFEETLMDWCGEQRVGNLFCLRASDAEAQLLRLASAVRYGRYADINDQEGLRYAAMNYTALGKFGSLEFRGYPALYEARKIDLWTRALLALKDFAEKYETPPDIIMEFSRSGAEDFFKMVLGEELWKEFVTPTYQNQLRNGMRLIQNVAYCVNWEKGDLKKKDPSEETEEGVLVADAWPDEEPPRRGRPIAPGGDRGRIQMPAWADPHPPNIRFEMGPDGQVREAPVRPAPPRPAAAAQYGVVHGDMRYEGNQWAGPNNEIYRIRELFCQRWDAFRGIWVNYVEPLPAAEPERVPVGHWHGQDRFEGDQWIGDGSSYRVFNGRLQMFDDRTLTWLG